MVAYIHVYREVVEPERIVYSGGPDCGHPCRGGLPPRALVTMTFAAHDGKTTHAGGFQEFRNGRTLPRPMRQHAPL
jgi:uncharacterized protein YndB with AHSA1/START domain